MKEYNFYEYYEIDDKIKIYSEDIYNYFKSEYNIIVNSIEFDNDQNVILYTDNSKNKIVTLEIEKQLLLKIEHLNDAEIEDIKIILSFNCNEIELC